MTLRVAMNGVTGRMGYRQHLTRSILAIRDQGGVPRASGERVEVEPILVGRNPAKLAELAARHDIAHWTTNLDTALSDAGVYFDAQVTTARAAPSSARSRPASTSTPRSPPPKPSPTPSNWRNWPTRRA